MSNSTVILNLFQDPCELAESFHKHSLQSLMRLSTHRFAPGGGDFAWIPDQVRNDSGQECAK